MHVCEVPRKEGFCSGITDAALTETERQQLSRCVRIFPHKTVGEGHFAVLLQKGDSSAVEQESNSAEQENSLAERVHDHGFRMAEKNIKVRSRTKIKI